MKVPFFRRGPKHEHKEHLYDYRVGQVTKSGFDTDGKWRPAGEYITYLYYECDCGATWQVIKPGVYPDPRRDPSEVKIVSRLNI